MNSMSFYADTVNGCFVSKCEYFSETIENSVIDTDYIVTELSEGFEGVRLFVVSPETFSKVNDVFGIYTAPSSGEKVKLD